MNIVTSFCELISKNILDHDIPVTNVSITFSPSETEFDMHVGIKVVNIKGFYATVNRILLSTEEDFVDTVLINMAIELNNMLTDSPKKYC